ncbi:MAG: hypothetical protein MJ211_14550 [Bacteroidales bacterium]|nr:hypothetical protein [Bacteroidales bacterium]
MEFLRNLANLFVFNPDKPIIFSSGHFLLLFIVFLIIYTLLLKKRILNSLFVVGFSFLFYYLSSGEHVILLFITTILTYYLGIGLNKAETETSRKIWLAIGILPGLLALAYFKYTNFFITNINQIIESNFALKDIALPVGISFYTFQSISYMIDIYRKKVDPADNILDFAFYLVFFPQLVAGPIVKANHFLPQLKTEPNISSKQANWGLWLIIIGLVKKGVIADYIAQYNDLIFAAPQNYSGFENLMGVFGYALQIFCDFSGYSDMAIGIGKVMGYDLGINFNSPYKSLSVSEFWKRWHISLSTWLQEYLYIPLGGNRTFSKFSLYSIPTILILSVLLQDASLINIIIVLTISVLGILSFYSNKMIFTIITLLLSTIMAIVWFNSCLITSIILIVGLILWLIALANPNTVKYIQTDINLLLTMLIGGLWHGSAWKFVFWGGAHGVALGIDKLIKKFLPSNIFTKILMWLLTFTFVVFLWIFFRASDISYETELEDGTTQTVVVESFKVPFIILEKVFTDFDIQFAVHFWDARYIWVIMLLFGFVCHFIPEQISNKIRDVFIEMNIVFKILILLIVCQLVIQFASETVQPFIYFQF